MCEKLGIKELKNTSSETKNCDDFIQDKISFLDSKLKSGIIDKDTYDKFSNELKELIDDHQNDKEKLKIEYEKKKADIKKQTGEELSEGRVGVYQEIVYNELGIDKNTYSNGLINKFKKGVVDSIIVGNMELIAQIIKEGVGIFIDMIKSLFSIEGIKEILKSIKASIKDLFSGDSYEKGKSVGDLGLAALGGGLLLKVGKDSIKNSIKKKGRIDNRDIDFLDNKELTQVVVENNIKKLDITEFSSQNKARTNDILTLNHPLIEVTRLVPGDQITNINIGGIKKINDTLGQEFTDKVINNFKEKLALNFRKTDTGRIVKSDYKNMTFVSKNTDHKNSIFGNYDKKFDLIEKVINDLSKDIKDKAILKIQSQIDSKKLNISGKKEFDEFVSKEIIETKDLIRQNFDFGVGTTNIPINGNNISKLDAIRKAEISSRPNKSLDIKPQIYDEKIIFESINKAFAKEKEIIIKFGNDTFEFNGISYKACYNGEISSELLRYVRKYPNEIKPQKLSDMVSDYIQSLNNSLDFISPTRSNITPDLHDLKIAEKINRDFRNNIVDTKYLTHNFKGGLTKDAFFETIKQKVGSSIFIDIKDMGIDNLFDFKYRAKALQKLKSDFDKGIISKTDFDKKSQVLFLEAGKRVTDKFVESEKIIKRKYPNSVLSFGGDEIFLFIPDLKDSKNIGKELSDIFENTNQQARITIKETMSDSKTYSNLDILTKINKVFEETLESIFVKNNISLNKLPNSTYLNISSRLQDMILNKELNLDFLIKELKSKSKLIDNMSEHTIKLDGIGVLNYKKVGTNLEINLI